MTQTKPRPPSPLGVCWEGAHRARCTSLSGQRSSFSVRGKRKAGLSRVPETSGAQSGEAKLPSQAWDSWVRRKGRKTTTKGVGGCRQSRQNEQWLGKNLGVKTHSSIVKVKTRSRHIAMPVSTTKRALCSMTGWGTRWVVRCVSEGRTKASSSHGMPEHDLSQPGRTSGQQSH